VATKKEWTGRVDVMSHEAMAAVDDQSHYEISLTAGQAFVAFVLLLLSLAASFAFGLMIGKGQGDERLIVRKEPAVITEAGLAAKKQPSGRIVELGVADDDFKQSVPPAAASAATSTVAPVVTEVAPPNPSVADAPATVAGSETASAPPTSTPPSTWVSTPPRPAVTEAHPAAPAPAPAVAAPAIKSGPAYAQLLSTGDQKTAEGLAAKVIDRGFTSAYVERNVSEKGTIFRVRVRFPSEADARAAEPRLREFSKDVWITR
jgi:cell division septation protein DedD